MRKADSQFIAKTLSLAPLRQVPLQKNENIVVLKLACPKPAPREVALSTHCRRSRLISTLVGDDH